MHRQRFVRSRLALTSALLLSACTSADIDESDHSAFFVDARVRKQLDGKDDHTGPYAEAEWTSSQGDAGPLEYSIGMLTLGGGMETPVGTQGWVGIGGGFAWQLNDLDTSAGKLTEENGFGIYVGFEGGWRATSWLEPCARIGGTLSVNEFASSQLFEVGARLHFIEHTALFVGWRTTHYDIDDFDTSLNISSVELDTSGPVVGVLFSF